MASISKLLYNIKTYWQWVLLFVGAVFLAVSLYHFDQQSTWWWLLCNRVGEIIIIGSIVGFLSSHGVIIDSYRKELTELFFKGEVICKRTDIDNIWNTVSKQLFKSKFPKIHVQLMALVKDGYFPTNEISYYGNFYDAISVAWSDKATGDLYIEHNANYTVFTDNVNEIAFEQYNKIVVDRRDDGNYDDCCRVAILIDGEPVTQKSHHYDDASSTLTTTCLAKLSGNTEYKISRETKKRYNIHRDHCISFRAKQITDQMSVTLSLPEDISFTFLECGTKSDFSKKKTGNIWSFQYKSLILPKQGYSIILKPNI